MAGEYRPSVNQLRKLGNFSQMFRWGIRVIEWPASLGASWKNSQSFNIRAKSASVPEKSGESTEISIRGSKVRQPGIYSYTSPWTCNLLETNNTYVQGLLSAWANLCWDTNLRNSTGDSRGWTDYKTMLEGVFELNMLDNLDNPIYRYTLIGAYVEQFTRGDFDSEAAEPMEPNVSFAFDYFTEGPVYQAVAYPSVWADDF